MKKTFILLLVALLTATLALSGCGQKTADQPADKPAEKSQPIVLKVGSVLTPTNPAVMALEKFGQIVEEKSQGKIDVQVFHSAQLGGEREQIEAIKIGALQMANVGTGLLNTMEPRFVAFDFPYVFRDREHAYKVVDGPIGQELLKGLEKEGIMGLGYAENGLRHITNSKRPINKPEDVKGLKIRAPQNKLYMANMEALGANVVPMGFGEVFTALQQGVIDGQENPLPTNFASSFHEVNKYWALTGHMWGPYVWLIGKSFFEGLPADLQQIVKDAAKESIQYERELIQKGDAEIVDKVKAMGVTVTEPDLKPFMEATQVVYDKYAKEMGVEEVIAQIKAVQ